MPTKKPRILITLEPEQKAALDEMAEVVGASVSSIVRHLIQEAIPAFAKTVMVIRQAKTSPAAAFDQMADYMARGKHKTLRRAKRK